MTAASFVFFTCEGIVLQELSTVYKMQRRSSAQGYTTGLRDPQLEVEAVSTAGSRRGLSGEEKIALL